MTLQFFVKDTSSFFGVLNELRKDNAVTKNHWCYTYMKTRVEVLVWRYNFFFFFFFCLLNRNPD